jgi:hypothetical protein
MKVNRGEGASELVALFPASFPVPEDVADGAASVRGSNVAKGSRRALESGFPRRSRGRFGSSIGSSEAEGFAVFVSDVAGGFVASGVVEVPVGGAAVGCAGGVVGFCSSFFSFSFSFFESPSAWSLWR